jgi:hypothetical protein
MGTVTVTPTEFALVEFDAARITRVSEKLLSDIGLDADLTVEVNEASPLARIKVESLEPLRVGVDGGSFEDPRHPRQLSEAAVADTLGRLLFQVKDRLDPSFGAPEFGEAIDLPYKVAWDCYATGRLARLGYRSQRQRWLYHFRNRCGFTDAADGCFEQIWEGSGLSWADLCAMVDEALAARDAAA